MSILGLDPGDPNNWYQSPQLGLFPAGYGGGISGNYYCAWSNHLQGNPYGQAQMVTNFTQPNPYPPPPHNPSGTIINGHLLPHQFPCVPQTHSHFIPPPYLQPIHPIAPPSPIVALSEGQVFDPPSPQPLTFVPQPQFPDPKPLSLNRKSFRRFRHRVAMAAKARIAKKTRNPYMLHGVGTYSRSKMYHKRGLWAIQEKNGGAFPRHNSKAAVEIMEELGQLRVGRKTLIDTSEPPAVQSGTLPTTGNTSSFSFPVTEPTDLSVSTQASAGSSLPPSIQATNPSSPPPISGVPEQMEVLHSKLAISTLMEELQKPRQSLYVATAEEGNLATQVDFASPGRNSDDPNTYSNASNHGSHLSEAKISTTPTTSLRTSPNNTQRAPLVVSPKAVSDSKNSQTCLDPDASRSVLGIILGGGAGTRLYPLTKKRTKPVVPLGANYRLIDIPVSNCLNSNVSKICNVSTLSSALQSYINSNDPSPGQKIHAHILKSGFRPNNNVSIKLLIFHLKCGSLKYARQMFDELPARTLSSYNYLISGNLKHGEVEESINLVRRLVLCGERPDGYTFSMILKASTCHGNVPLPSSLGRMVHAQIIKSDVEADDVLYTALVSSYVRNGILGYARSVFDMMLEKNIVCSTSMISGYMSQGSVEDAEDIFRRTVEKDVVVFNAMIEGYSKSVGSAKKSLEVYVDMQRLNFQPNISTFASLIGACSALAAIKIGQQVQCQLMKTNLFMDIKMGSALLDMYSKCGRVEEARRIFDHMPQRNVFSWTSMIDGYGKNGYPDEALELFSIMQKEHQIKPNFVTFLSALSACGHAGLVDKGLDIFESMKSGLLVLYFTINLFLVGKIERNIYADDPRKPAVITDIVGDNFGVIAGMESDLFSSYAESFCAALVVASISSLVIHHEFTTMLYPLFVSSMGILVCEITTLFATAFFEIKPVEDIEPALKKQLIISSVLITIGIAIDSWVALPSSFTIYNIRVKNVVKNCLIEDFKCAFQENILTQGHMYLFIHYICLYSNILRYETKKIIPFQEVTSVREVKMTGIFPNAIEEVLLLMVGDKKYFFAPFLSCDGAYRIINDVWSQYVDGAIVTTAQLESISDTTNQENGVVIEKMESSNRLFKELDVIDRNIITHLSKDFELPRKVEDTDGYWKWVASNLASGGASSLLFVYSLYYARTHLARDSKATKKGGERQFNGLVDVYRKTLKSDGMIVAENLRASTEQNLILETLQMTRLANGEAEISHHKSNNEVFGKDASTDDVNGNTLPDVSSKKAGQQKEMTFQDVYNQDLDDVDDDSDWEPLQKNVELVKWFCTNCTMVNLGDVMC